MYNMNLPNNTLPESDEELIQMMGLDDEDVDINNETNGESTTWFEDSQRYQQNVGNSLGVYQPTETITHAEFSPTGINNQYQIPLNLFTNDNQGYEAIRDGYSGSYINKLVENIIPDLDDSNEGIQERYYASNTNKIVDDIIMDLDLNSFIDTFSGVPASTTRFESSQDNQQVMDNFQMVYQPTEIISYIDMSESGFEDSLY